MKKDMPVAQSSLSQSKYNFRKYTTFSRLLPIIMRGEIVLTDPLYWEDKNDVSFMKEYKKRKKLKTLLASCFVDVSEAFHHWKIFAPGSEGVCISFDRDKFIEAIPSEEGGFRHQPVSYKQMKELKGCQFHIDEIPFIKRYPYIGEGEYRVIFESKDTEKTNNQFSIPLSAIQQIIISPWLYKSSFSDVRLLIEKFDQIGHARVFQSTLLENDNWSRIMQMRIVDS